MSSRVNDKRIGWMIRFARGFCVIIIHEVVVFLRKGSVIGRGLFAHCSGFIVLGVINIAGLFIRVTRERYS